MTLVSKIAKVVSARDGWDIVDLEKGCTFVPLDLCQIRPRPGETIRLLDGGLGRRPSCILIGGRTYRWERERVEA